MVCSFLFEEFEMTEMTFKEDNMYICKGFCAEQLPEPGIQIVMDSLSSRIVDAEGCSET